MGLHVGRYYSVLNFKSYSLIQSFYIFISLTCEDLMGRSHNFVKKIELSRFTTT